MRTFSCVVAMFLAGISVAAPGLPEQKLPPKKGPPEDQPIVTVAWSQDGAILIERQSVRLVNEMRTQQVVVDGKVMNVNVTVQVPVAVVMTVQLDPKTLEVKSGDGKPVDAADVAKLLKEKTKAIVSLTGKPVAEELIKEHKGAVIIVVKPKK